MGVGALLQKGGVIVTDREEWVSKAKYLTTQARADPRGCVHTDIGCNCRLTNIEVAMGCAQMEELDEHVSIKRRVAATFTMATANLPGLNPHASTQYVLAVYCVPVDPQKYGITSRDLLRKPSGNKVRRPGHFGSRSTSARRTTAVNNTIATWRRY